MAILNQKRNIEAESVKESILIHALKYASIANNLEISDAKIFKIIKAYGSIESFLNDPYEKNEVYKRKEKPEIDISTEALSKLIDFDNSFERLKSYQELGISFTNFLADDYPKELRELEKPPMMIYYYGDLKNLKHEKGIGIVGTRRASLYGKKATRSLVQALKDKEPVIISGLARGIDSEAHLAALDAKVPTVAVLGCGLLKIHERFTNPIFDEIAKDPNSLIISEFEPKQSATRWTFPLRNRIISALSKVTVVIEAGNRSGALITARYSSQLKRKIFAVPGELDRETFQGVNEILADGTAEPLYKSKQISDYLESSTGTKTKSHLNNTSRLKKQSKEDLNKANNNKRKLNHNQKLKIYNDSLTPISKVILDSITKIASYDQIQAKTELDQATLNSNLIQLEIKGLLKKLSASRYQKS